MRFDPPLEEVIFLRRYKRFFADVELSNGRKLTVHCPNPGSMLSCLGEKRPALISESSAPKRKLSHTLEMLHNGHSWIGVNTLRANTVVEEAIQKEKIPELKGYAKYKREVGFGKSRIDFMLGEDCYVEVKSVSLKQDGLYRFPDSITQRGQKHLETLNELVQAQNRAVIFFLIQRSDAKEFAPAEKIDPHYAKLLRKAHSLGVEILAYQAQLDPNYIEVQKRVPLRMDA